MRYILHRPATLFLEDGTVFHGISIGKIGISVGEICFNTGMTGYGEVFTDPSYFGQIMVATNVHIGNYGIKQSESQAEGMMIAGLVVRTMSDMHSRKLADLPLSNFLLENNLVGISEVDTRALVLHIRDKGAMNAIISSEDDDIDTLMARLKSVPDMAGLELSTSVSTSHAYELAGKPEGKRVAILDLGIKRNILHNLTSRGCNLKVFPARTSAAELMDFNPDGYLISNGPGDPSAMPYAVQTAIALAQSGKPTFGICLGHQILAQAYGVPTFKMKNGHRGLNHPVRNLLTGRCEVTSQNHGFGIDRAGVEASKVLEVTHINLNDDSVEGIRHKEAPVWSVQYHPEASPGPHDASYLFDEFVDKMST